MRGGGRRAAVGGGKWNRPGKFCFRFRSVNGNCTLLRMFTVEIFSRGAWEKAFGFFESGRRSAGSDGDGLPLLTLFRLLTLSTLSTFVALWVGRLGGGGERGRVARTARPALLSSRAPYRQTGETRSGRMPAKGCDLARVRCYGGIGRFVPYIRSDSARRSPSTFRTRERERDGPAGRRQRPLADKHDRRQKRERLKARLRRRSGVEGAGEGEDGRG